MGIAYSIDFLMSLAPSTAGKFDCLMVIVDRWSRPALGQLATGPGLACQDEVARHCHTEAFQRGPPCPGATPCQPYHRCCWRSHCQCAMNRVYFTCSR